MKRITTVASVITFQSSQSNLTFLVSILVQQCSVASHLQRFQNFLETQLRTARFFRVLCMLPSIPARYPRGDVKYHCHVLNI